MGILIEDDTDYSEQDQVVKSIRSVVRRVFLWIRDDFNERDLLCVWKLGVRTETSFKYVSMYTESVLQ